MPKHLAARPPVDGIEERQVRKLAHSVHAPADWIFHAKMIVCSWERIAHPPDRRGARLSSRDGASSAACLQRPGLDGLGMLPGSGRKPRLTELERSAILALVKLPPPGKPTYEADRGTRDP